jgi:quercetin dioxygenase-like cupin family protein
MPEVAPEPMPKPMPEQTRSMAPDTFAPTQQAIRSLIGEIVALYSADLRLQPAAAALAAASLPEHLDVRSHRLPVARHIETALANASNGPCAALAAALHPLAPGLCWQQNSNYLTAPPSPQFLDNYGYVEFVGPGRAIASDVLRVGVLLLGPETAYPAHHHPAEEIYHVISGRARWWQRATGWHAESAGSVIHHAPGAPHAMTCNEQPLLALYCWLGDIRTAAELC